MDSMSGSAGKAVRQWKNILSSLVLRVPAGSRLLIWTILAKILAKAHPDIHEVVHYNQRV